MNSLFSKTRLIPASSAKSLGDGKVRLKPKERKKGCDSKPVKSTRNGEREEILFQTKGELTQG